MPSYAPEGAVIFVIAGVAEAVDLVNAVHQLVVDEDLAIAIAGIEPILAVEDDEEVGEAPEEALNQPLETWIEIALDARQMRGAYDLAAALDLEVAFEQPVDGGLAVDEVHVLGEPQQREGKALGIHGGRRQRVGGRQVDIVVNESGGSRRFHTCIIIDYGADPKGAKKKPGNRCQSPGFSRSRRCHHPNAGHHYRCQRRLQVSRLLRADLKREFRRAPLVGLATDRSIACIQLHTTCAQHARLRTFLLNAAIGAAVNTAVADVDDRTA